MDNLPSAKAPGPSAAGLMSVAFQRLGECLEALAELDHMLGTAGPERAAVASIGAPPAPPVAEEATPVSPIAAAPASERPKYYAERRLAARSPYEAGDPYDAILAIANALPGPAWSKKDLQNQATIHGWRRRAPRAPAPVQPPVASHPPLPLRSEMRGAVLRHLYSREDRPVPLIVDRLNEIRGPALCRQDVVDWIADLGLRRPSTLSPDAKKPAPAPDPRPVSVPLPQPPKNLRPIVQSGDPAALPTQIESGHTAGVIRWAEAVKLASDLGLTVFKGTSPASLRGMINDALGKKGRGLVTVLAPRPGDPSF